MRTIKKQYYGIKFPFTAENTNGFFLDLNDTVEDKVASEILHTILTPKRSRIRKPDFGTNLAKYIFEPSDSLTWPQVESEVKEAVSKYVANAELTSIEIKRNEDDDNEIFLDMQYAVKRGNITENNRLAIKL